MEKVWPALRIRLATGALHPHCIHAASTPCSSGLLPGCLVPIGHPQLPDTIRVTELCTPPQPIRLPIHRSLPSAGRPARLPGGGSDTDYLGRTAPTHDNPPPCVPRFGDPHIVLISPHYSRSGQHNGHCDLWTAFISGPDRTALPGLARECSHAIYWPARSHMQSGPVPPSTNRLWFVVCCPLSCTRVLIPFTGGSNRPTNSHRPRKIL